MSYGYQERVHKWILHCFGATIGADKIERNHRFLEESLELVQAGGCTASEAHQLVDYVFARPTGVTFQEAGGVMVTLAALCNAHRISMSNAAETELARAWSKTEQIRAKQAAKPRHSPLPASSQDEPPMTMDRLRDRINMRLNDHLVEMKPDYDDSIVGFNEAWDIVRNAFAEILRPSS